MKNGPRTRKDARAGGAGLEILIAASLIGIIAMALLSASTASLRGSKAIQDKELALQAASGLRETLRGYVSAQADARTAPYAPGGSWHLPDDRCAGCPTNNCYALDQNCVHEVTSRLPEALRHKGFAMSYQVAAADPQPADPEILKVVISVNIPEGQ